MMMQADKVFASFMAAGPASVNTNSPVQSVDYILNPSDFSGAIPDRAQADPYIPYTSSTGKVEYLNTRFGQKILNKLFLYKHQLLLLM